MIEKHEDCWIENHEEKSWREVMKRKHEDYLIKSYEKHEDCWIENHEEKSWREVMKRKHEDYLIKSYDRKSWYKVIIKYLSIYLYVLTN